MKGTGTLELKGYWCSWGWKGLNCTCYPEAQEFLGTASCMVFLQIPSGGLAGNTDPTAGEEEWLLPLELRGMGLIARPEHRLHPRPLGRAGNLSFSCVSCRTSESPMKAWWGRQHIIQTFCTLVYIQHLDGTWVTPLRVNKRGFCMKKKTYTQILEGRKQTVVQTANCPPKSTILPSWRNWYEDKEKRWADHTASLQRGASPGAASPHPRQRSSDSRYTSPTETFLFLWVLIVVTTHGCCFQSSWESGGKQVSTRETVAGRRVRSFAEAHAFVNRWVCVCVRVCCTVWVRGEEVNWQGGLCYVLALERPTVVAQMLRLLTQGVFLLWRHCNDYIFNNQWRPVSWDFTLKQPI